MGSHKRVALVTEVARGIGEAIAINLAKEEVDVIINYRPRPDAAEEVIKVIKEMRRLVSFLDFKGSYITGGVI